MRLLGRTKCSAGPLVTVETLRGQDVMLGKNECVIVTVAGAALSVIVTVTILVISAAAVSEVVAGGVLATSSAAVMTEAGAELGGDAATVSGGASGVLIRRIAADGEKLTGSAETDSAAGGAEPRGRAINSAAANGVLTRGIAVVSAAATGEEVAGGATIGNVWLCLRPKA